MFTSTGKAIELGRQLGAGGAGTVYEIEGQPDLVAKRYHQPPSAEHIARLHALAQRSDERLTKIAAWPTDVLFDQPAEHVNRQVIGFVMPRVDRAAEVHTLHSPKSRLQKFPDATWAFLIHTAANIARAVATVHEAGFVVGDVNPKNILVTRQGTVALLDCDSFQFTANDKTYRCEAGFPEYTPPELQGVTFREVDRTAQHDAFGLAVVIFQLLFLGRHPFAGKFFGEGEMPLERAIREGRFAYGNDSATRQMHAPPGVLPWHALPDDLAGLFERTFLTPQRAMPPEWLAPLERLAQALKTCADEPLHLYSDHLTDCLWCDLEARVGLKLFGSVNIALPNQAFILENIWHDISQVEAPWLASVPQPAANEIVVTPEARKAGKMRFTEFPLTCLTLAAICYVIGAFGGCSFFLILFVTNATRLFQFLTSLEQRVRERLGFSSWSSAKTSAVLQRTHEVELQEAQAALKILDDRWEAEASREIFFAKKDQLKAHYEEYEKLNQKRLERLRELEQDSYRLQPATAAGAAPRLLPRSRWQVEQEIKTHRLELEQVLERGAETLQTVRQQIEGKRREMHDDLIAAQRRLTQIEANYEAASQRTLTTPIVAMLILSFVLGAGYNILSDPIPYDTTSSENRTVETKPPLPPPPLVVPHEPPPEAASFYADARVLLQQNRFREASEKLSAATILDPKFGIAFEDLAYALYRTNKFDEAVPAAKQAIYLRAGFRPYALLGNIYFAKKNWDGARIAFEQAFNDTPSDWNADYLLAEEQYVKTLIQLNLHTHQILTLESSRIITLTEQLRLGLLYVELNKLPEAKKRRDILTRAGANKAAQLLTKRLKTLTDVKKPN